MQTEAGGGVHAEAADRRGPGGLHHHGPHHPHLLPNQRRSAPAQQDQSGGATVSDTTDRTSSN